MRDQGFALSIVAPRAPTAADSTGNPRVEEGVAWIAGDQTSAGRQLASRAPLPHTDTSPMNGFDRWLALAGATSCPTRTPLRLPSRRTSCLC